eukprot:IDg6107t1
MQPDVVQCTECGLSYGSTRALGRHAQSAHRLSHTNQLRSITHTLERVSHIELDSILETPENELLHFDDSLFENVPIDDNVADDVFEFYNALQDRSEIVFEDSANLKIPVANLCNLARKLLYFCCSQKLTHAQISTSTGSQSKVTLLIAIVSRN